MEDISISQLLLQEFRAFRDVEFREFASEILTWKQDIGERVSSIESKIKPALENNGQPSRLSVVENRVTALERERWRVAGAIGAMVVVSGMVWEFVKHKLFGF